MLVHEGVALLLTSRVRSDHIRDLVDFLIRSCMNHLQNRPKFHIWFWRAIQIGRKVRSALSVFKIFIRLEYCLYLHNSSTISRVELEKKTKEIRHD